MLEKTFRPETVETRLYEAWEASGAFKAGRRPDAAPYTIVIPPPNVTGSLHMGHALNNTLQDILVRYQRMRGRDVLWQPGTDHAGIATQMVVERQLALEQVRRQDLGREKFIERVWTWKAESGGTIVNQLRRLGASCDWSRERFTMDEGLSAAVTTIFVRLYNDGLIYKDKRLVNWDPKFLTAISDLEVVSKEVKGNLWHFRYPIEGAPDRFIVVATTRPETMLGDTAVAVHPEDERYKDLIGKYVVLPLVGRKIPIVADEYADPETGSGAVKITPAHDFNDFEVGRRHNLPMFNILDAHAHLNDEVPEQYRGLERFEARRRVVADLDALGLLEKIDPHTHLVPHGDRSDAVIEPWLTDQWYVNPGELARRAIEAVETGRTEFVPKNWEKTYFQWMRNIEPWCISRQLWWGHQIPAWYGPPPLDDAGQPTNNPFECFVAETEAEVLSLAQRHYGECVNVKIGFAPQCFAKNGLLTDITLMRDPDVLDTWFSSQLWPFSTLGWPEETPELKRYYPTDVLVTGFDIIFFWVARMMMAGLYVMDEVPFKTVYIHALVRDEKGAKMSKSKGNVMDPLDLIGKFGADALRMTLTALAAQGRDIKLSEQRIEGYRNFVTKLWNAARFCEMNECKLVPGFDPAGLSQTVNKWIVGETVKAAATVTQALDTYKFNDAALGAYQFVWGVYCDWYLELAKPLFAGTDETAKAETRATAAWALDQILKMLHPIMPFVTEELWQVTATRDVMLIEAAWPDYSFVTDAAAVAEIDWMIRLVSGIRSVRSEMNVPASAEVPLTVTGANEETRRRLDQHRALIARLARLASIDLAQSVPKGAVQLVQDEATVALPLAGLIDLEAEKIRLAKDLDKSRSEAEKLTRKLSDENFVSRAPEDIIEENRERLADIEARAARLADALSRLQGAA